MINRFYEVNYMLRIKSKAFKEYQNNFKGCVRYTCKL